MALKVRYKPTGQLGTIPEDKFDPNLFELVGSSTPTVPTAPTGGTQQMGQIISPDQLIKLSLLDPKGADKYKALYDVVNSAGMPEISEAEKKRQGELQGVAGLIDELKVLYNQPNASGVAPNAQNKNNLSAGRSGIFGNLGGKVLDIKAAWNMAPDAKTYKRLKEGFTASLKEVTGDSGILTDQDYARLAKVLPTFGDSDEAARKAWESVDRILASKGINSKYSYLDDPTLIDNKSASNRNAQDIETDVRTKPSVEQDQTISLKGQPSDSASNILTDILKRGALGAFPVANPEVYKLLEKIGLGSLGNIPAAGYEGARALNTGATNLTGNPNTMTGNNPYLSAEKERALSEGGVAAARNIVGEGLQGLSYAIPFGKGANVLSKVLAPGAGVGLLSGTGERLEKGALVSAETMAKDIAMGVATGWFIDRSGRVISGTGKTLKGKANSLVNKLLKPGKAGIDFNAKTGLDFADEILKKDGKNISGKSMDEIEKYFETKYEAMEGAADSYLKSSGETMPKDDIIKIIDTQIDSLTAPGRDISTDLVRELQVTRDAISSVPGDLPLDVWNQTKRDWYQKSTFTAGGDTTKSSSYKSLARSLNDMLEKKAPGFKGVNKDIMLYRLAKDSASRQAQSLAQRESGGILSTLAAPVAAGGIAAGAATGNPLFAALGMLPAVKEVSRMPQVRAGAANLLNKTPSTQIPDFLMKLLLQGGTRFGSGL